MTDYIGDSNSYPASLPLLSDGVPPAAVQTNVPLEALADRTAYLKAHLGQIAALTFNTVAPTTPVTFDVLKHSDVLGRWFGLSVGATELLTSTQQMLVWPAVTDVPVPQRLGAVMWDFDLDSSGNMLVVSQTIDNITKRTAAGTWSNAISDGNTTAEPNIIWEPVSGNWILAYSTGAVLWTQTSGNLWTTRTTRTSPTFPGAARVTMGHNGAGRVVMQGFSGTNTYFSYSDDGGVTWSAPTTLALGFTYSSTGRHNPRPVFNGKAWVAVAMNTTTGVSRVFTSPDGATWSIGSSFTSTAICNIAGLGGIVLGSTIRPGGTNGGIVHSSDDGATFRRGEGTYIPSGAAPRGVIATASRFVILSTNQVYPGIGFLEGGGLVT